MFENITLSFIIYEIPIVHMARSVRVATVIEILATPQPPSYMSEFKLAIVQIFCYNFPSESRKHQKSWM